MLNFRLILSGTRNFLEAFEIPIFKCFITGSTRQCECLRIIIKTIDSIIAALMLWQFLNYLSGIQLPYLYYSISTSACYPSTIRRNRAIFYGRSVFLKSENCISIASSSIPNFNFSIFTGRH